jgi:hypothetical protein
MALLAQELRIGNWYTSVKWGIPVECELTDFTQLDYMSDGAYKYPPIDEIFEPIPLTEEWLLKFGFDIYEDPFHYFIDIGNGEIPEYFNVWYYDNYYDANECNAKLYYVHQLQNLYFALTGNELNINYGTSN